MVIVYVFGILKSSEFDEICKCFKCLERRRIPRDRENLRDLLRFLRSRGSPSNYCISLFWPCSEALAYAYITRSVRFAFSSVYPAASKTAFIVAMLHRWSAPKMMLFTFSLMFFCASLEFRFWLNNVFLSFPNPSHSPAMLPCSAAEMVHVLATNVTDAKHRFRDVFISSCLLLILGLAEQ